MARAYAGIAAPLIVMTVLLEQGATTAGYDPVRQTISELGTGWNGTRIVALYGALLLLVICPPVWKRLNPGPSAVALIGALTLTGVGCVGLALVDAESGSWSRMTWRGQLHLIFAFVFVFGGIPLACLAAWRALPTAWGGLRAVSLILGVACLAVLAGTLFALEGARPSEAVVANLGLIERAYVFAFLLWQCAVSAAVARRQKSEILR